MLITAALAKELNFGSQGLLIVKLDGWKAKGNGFITSRVRGKEGQR